MGNELQKVGLIFKEDGSADFIKSMQLVNAALRENYQTFQLTQAQWDESTTVTQKLNDRLDYLNDAYDLQKDKVNILKNELEELENAENKDELAIQKKKAALAQAEGQLQRYSNQIEDVTSKIKIGSEKIKDFGNKVIDAGNKVQSIANKTKAFSTATTAAFIASTKTAIDFDDAMTGVEKTVDGTDKELAEIRQGIRNMAKEIPASTTEIAGVAEAAGQLGIKTKDILSFTKVMVDMGNATNLSAEEAASALAKFANITKMDANNYSNLGSVIVALGNNFATTEADIVSMSTRLAATGELTGLTESQIMALATAMSSVGIEAEAGGSAMSKLLKKMQVAVETGGQSLEDFSKVAGKSTEEFKKAFKEDAVSALSLFISGLNDTKRNGKSAIAVLEDMELKEVRLSNTILSLASSGDLLNNAVDLANKSWKENNALSAEAEKRYSNLKSKISIMLNKIKDMGITLGNKLTPSLDKVVDRVSIWIDKFDKLDDSQVDFIVRTGLVVAALTPVLSIIGKTYTGIGNLIVGYGKLKESLGKLVLISNESKNELNGILGVIQAMKSPIGLACTAVAVGVAGIAIAVNKANEEVRKDFETMGNSASNFVKGINTAESHLSSFNSTLFASAEEQQKLQQNMDSIQQGITKICQKATDERRDYTKKEIAQLDEYFQKLRELKDREIQIQNQIAQAISQQATTNAKNFQGSLEEYKLQSQEWIKTAQEQKNATVKLIEEGTIEEIALLNQRYTTEEQRQTEAYQSEYNKIMEQKQKKIDNANEEVAKVNEVYANGYYQRLLQDEDFSNKVKELNAKLEEENQRHNNKITEMDNSGMSEQLMIQGYYEEENQKHTDNLKRIWKQLSKGMSEEQAEQLGVFIGMTAEAELYGGKLETEAQNTANNIVSSYETMPNKTREVMKNAMSPMLDEMEKAEPSLFAKAWNIGVGIWGRLQKAFDEHSPSKKTRKIMKYAMQPMEEEMEIGKKELFKKADEIGNGLIDRLGNIDTSGVNINSSYSDKKSINPENKRNEIEIDYNKLANALIKALTSCKIALDEEGFTRFIDNRILEVM